jgi:superfamily II DNA or RNA helicase
VDTSAEPSTVETAVEGLRFRWPWRNYQARVLQALESHLSDQRLHVVAAPGSGKTVLGLEVFRRLARPTVVLSPTRTIRDQWVERLGDFLDGADPRKLPWKSRDMAALRFFNSLTYQALHTRVRLAAAEADLESEEAEALEDEAEGDGPSAEEIGAVTTCFRDAGIQVLILDEAHHLRAEWWGAIQQIVDAVPGMILVSLTATPPYDVVGHEWARYIELCGPIDEEISVPELVKAGTLCPHQDYIRLVRCAGGEVDRIAAHRRASGHLIRDLGDDPAFLADMLAHPWLQAPQDHAGAILQAPDTAVAMALFAASREHLSTPLLRLLDMRRADLPALDPRQWERLLRHYLFAPGWPEDAAFEQRRGEMARRMRAEGLLWRRELNLADPGRRGPRLSLAAEKAQACLDIHRLECGARGEDLCQVILTDFIRDEDYRQPVQRELPLGVWPIFHRLASGASSCRLGAIAMHSGRLSIIHQSLVGKLETLLPAGALSTRPVPALAEFVEIEARGDLRLTRALTRLLVARDIQVLVGTRALLGEGWDAPPINSLILASVVGSFMTTNQMRGRAIRIDPARPDKVASIWHLGAVARLDEGEEDVRDLADMIRRFETFVGLAHREPVIEGGIDRLRPGFWNGHRFHVPLQVARLNRAMARRLHARGALLGRWRAALDRSDIARVLPSVRVPKPPRLKVFSFWGTLRVLLGVLMGVVLPIIGLLRLPAEAGLSVGGFAHWLIAIGMALLLFAGPGAFRLARLYLRFLPVDGAVASIALAVRDALCETGLLPAHHRDARLFCQGTPQGGFNIALGHGSFAEQSLFAECLQQVLAPVENPRYLITRRQSRWNRMYTDYHAVPGVLGARKDRAEAFLRAWRQRVCGGQLIYTRSDEGRRQLLVARMRAFANAHERAARRIDRWF